jgi:endonuclease/exonuclease/phosphatase family metal-dependent hydrolase
MRALAAESRMMEPTTAISSTKPPRRHWQLLAVAVLIGSVIAWGSDRQPADATKPIEWRHALVAEPPSELLRVASFNIHGGKGHDRRVDLLRTAEALKDVDFAGLYEVRAFPWNSHPDQATELGERLRMSSAFLATERRWWHDHFGNAVLSKLPKTEIQRIPLVCTDGKGYRQAVLVDLPLGDEVVHVVMAHVSPTRIGSQQREAVIRLFLSLSEPAILMGDMNAGPNHPQIKDLLSQPGVKDVLETQLGSPIDYIIVRGLECVDAKPVDNGASDHPALKATLRLPGR